MAANRDQLAKATAATPPSPTKRVLDEAERARTKLAEGAERTSRMGLEPAQAQDVQRAAAQAAFIRRAVAPLDIDQLTSELAGVLRSDSSLGAKLLATDIVREQAEVRAGRESRVAGGHAIAERLLAQARRTLDVAQAGPGSAEPRLEHDAPSESERPEGTDVPSEGGRTGIDDLIAAIQEEREKTRDALREEGEKTRNTLREEGEKTRETIEGAVRAKGRIGLLIGLATLLVTLASVYLQAQGSPPTPRRASGAVSFDAQGPVVPAPAGPSGSKLWLGPPGLSPPREQESGPALSGTR